MLEKKQYDVFYIKSISAREQVRSAMKAAAEDYADSELCYSDLFAEVADSWTPVYPSELFEAVSDVDGYLQECFEEGLIVIDKDITLTKIIQVGYCEMIRQALYNEIGKIAYNCAIEILSEKDFTRFCNDSKWVNSFIPQLEDFAENFDADDGPREIREFIEKQCREYIQ